MIITNTTKNTILATAAEAATTSASRRKGLLGRKKLDTGEGLWIVPCESIHTFGMKFAIDVVYLDRNKKIRKIRRDVGPWRMSVSLLSHSVVELPSGTIERTGTAAGDQLVFQQ